MKRKIYLHAIGRLAPGFHAGADDQTIVPELLKQASFLILFAFLSASSCFGQSSLIQYLSGTDKDHTVSWDFYCTGGRSSGKWTTIPVPSCWELQGFGNYQYGGEKKPTDEEGLYKYRFLADQAWKNKQVNIVFEGVMTDAQVTINGKSAGKIHQGAFYPFKYDITSLLKWGKTNVLAVRVSKRSANASVNDAEREGDFWIFGGIFRPVYIEVLPVGHIDRVAIDARADGHFEMQVFLEHSFRSGSVEAVIEDLDGKARLSPVSVPVRAEDSMIVLQNRYHDVRSWSPEFPNLYRVKVFLKNKKGEVVHEIKQRFGFRTFTFKAHDGFYLNGEKVLFKGVNHHSLWPTSGRTTSKALAIQDITLMKEMNMNAVRMSHYPPDIHFLDMCDSLGLMVLDELTGWQRHYDDTTGHRLVKEMVTRDVNHPSIVIWDNGNEGGFNTHLDHDFGLYDPQQRIVIHPWGRFNGTNTLHYPEYNYLENEALYDDAVFFPTELLHGLYDGGSGAGLEDYWNLMQRMPHSAGGFLWDFADGGIVRTDKNDSIDTHGNKAPDGILGPFREKGGSFYAIKQIWSPMQIKASYLPTDFNGKLLLENHYLFTNLSQCTFLWELVSFSGPGDGRIKTRIDARGRPDEISILPGEKKWMNIRLPASWRSSDALYLTAWDPHHEQVATWSWPIGRPTDITHKAIRQSAGEVITATEEEDTLIINQGRMRFYFNKKTGSLEKILKSETALSLSGGPVLAGTEQELKSFSYEKENQHYTVTADYQSKRTGLTITWTFIPGLPVRLSYSAHQRDEAAYMGITFDYPKEKITGMRWLGRGPFHVWKNRLRGLQFGVWENDFPVSKDSLSWVSPEYKGNFSEVYWVKVKTTEFPFTVFMERPHVFFQLLQPDRQTGSAGRGHTSVKFPAGTIGFMHAIQPIGTKFKNAAALGPQSQPNIQRNETYEGVLWFDFSDL